MLVFQAIPENMIRQGSIDDINTQQYLKISNYEDTVRQLDIYYAIGQYFLNCININQQFLPHFYLKYDTDS